jgi:alpha-beta hydrolase superfamily lysophospholipase
MRPRRNRPNRAADAAAGGAALTVREVERAQPISDGYELVTLRTDRGDIEMRYYRAAAATSAAIFVGGAGGGFDTPVCGWLYPRLCEQLATRGVAALRIRYRKPAHLTESVLDVLAGIGFLGDDGARDLGLVGHSFGGAVVIRAAAEAAAAAAQAPAVKTCVALSTQSYGADAARDLSPQCSLLLAHGQADEVLPPDCSRHVYNIAGEPKKLLLHPMARHGLDEWADELPGIILDWLSDALHARPRRRATG